MLSMVVEYLIINWYFDVEWIKLIFFYFTKNLWLGFIFICYILIIWFIKINIDVINGVYFFKKNFLRAGVNISKNILWKGFRYIMHRIVR